MRLPNYTLTVTLLSTPAYLPHPYMCTALVYLPFLNATADHMTFATQTSLTQCSQAWEEIVSASLGVGAISHDNDCQLTNMTHL